MSALEKLVDQLQPRDMNGPTAGELAAFFSQLPPDTPVMCLDGFNGGGNKRILNYGPRVEKITKKDADSSSDCIHYVGEEAIVFGYGCY